MATNVRNGSRADIHSRAGYGHWDVVDGLAKTWFVIPLVGEVT